MWSQMHTFIYIYTHTYTTVHMSAKKVVENSKVVFCLVSLDLYVLINCLLGTCILKNCMLKFYFFNLYTGYPLTYEF